MWLNRHFRGVIEKANAYNECNFVDLIYLVTLRIISLMANLCIINLFDIEEDHTLILILIRNSF